jgi:uncharacterized ferritin-like protein (DUF455 family)
MELREWAIHILSADRIEDKLFDPSILTDNEKGSPIFWKEPSRPPGMEFSKHTRKKDKLPAFQDHHIADNRAICLHRFAGHELLAVEIMAFALLAFPDAPRSFRMGVANTLREEQEHVRLYIAQMERLGLKFGDLPLFKHFWKQTEYLTSPVDYISMMSLTLEMANLDFAPHYGASFKRNGDLESYELMKRILTDEISHVKFGMRWIQKLKSEDQDAFELYQESIHPHLPMKRARGFIFQEEPRREALVPEHWIHALKMT